MISFKRKNKGMTEGGMVKWYHWLDGHEFEQAPEVGDAQRKPGVLQFRGCKKLDITEQPNWNDDFLKFVI